MSWRPWSRPPLPSPRLNEPAPEFSATTTHGTKKLSDYKGKWGVLFSHPADFTPVCTTEFVAYSRIYPELRKLNADLIGLSIDSNFSHIAWVRNIEEHFGITIPFPIIADIDMKVAHLYGMVHPGASSTQAVRCVFFIDDTGLLRAMMYYPMNVGRNMDEVLRVLTALQTADREKVVVPLPQTQQAAEARMGEGYECTDWCLCMRDLV